MSDFRFLIFDWKCGEPTLSRRFMVALLLSVAERLSYVGESLRDSLNPKKELCRGTCSPIENQKSSIKNP